MWLYVVELVVLFSNDYQCYFVYEPSSQWFDFFWFVFYGPSRLFHSFWAESIEGGAKTGDSLEKTLTTHKENLAYLTYDPS